MVISPYSSSVESGTCADVSASVRIGASAGFAFWYDGGMIPCGSCRSVCAIAACTSCAAASMFRSSANCTTICVCPRLDVDVMLSMPAIVENDFSSGVATVAAIVCGLVPGRTAVTVMVGKSTFGRSLTGSWFRATMPKTRMPIMTRVVMTGRLMKSVVKFMRSFRGVHGPAHRGHEHGFRQRTLRLDPALEPRLEFVHVGVVDRRHVERDDLGEDEPTHHGDTERPARGGAGANTDGDREGADDRRKRGHHDRPEADVGGLHHRLRGLQPGGAADGDREVDHHDRVLLHDP